MLNNSSTAPRVLQSSLLTKITDGFSEKRKVGSGGYGEVYKGKLENGEEIAVKKLYPQPGLDDKQFMNEFYNLIKVKHENIVRLVGYCYEIQHEFVEHNGKPVFAQREYRILCFEYLHGGSLEKHLYEEHCGLDWRTRYKIIKGICEGLNYLHGLKESILHLDLKPANILLDKNMVPKIADFGLSRLFGETRTHITKNCIGTKKYMPPEFIQECKITKKYDVFSLGVIIIQIMTGREGYSKYHETSTSEQFIELVHNKWKVRIQATSMHTSPEEDCKQVKRCIEIALNCVEAERHKRPTIGDIIHKLRETETMHHEVSMSFSQEPGSVSSHFKREMVPNGKEFSPRLETMEEKRGRQGGEEDEEKAGFSKIGPWGGNAGRAHDIKVSSYRLESVTIWCADIVDALAFSYSDLNGKMHTVGPWGGPGGSPRTIKVGPSEFLMEVSGTTGPYICAVDDVVRSLTLVTNAGSYGPFGQGGGTAFHTSVQSDDSIVGFFGRAGWFVHALGVYVKTSLPTLAASRHFDDDALAKIGPWGGNGEMAHDMKVVPHRLETLTICSDKIIDSLAFSYNDLNGKQHTVGPWGGRGGSAFTIRLGAFEHLKGMSGTVGSFGSLTNVITSLTLFTDVKLRYGPFGEGGGTPFSVPVENHGSIVGFFGRAGSCVEALGVYIRTY